MQEIEEKVRNMDSPKKVLKLLDYLNFNNYSEPQLLDPSSLSLRKEERKNVKAIYTLNDYKNTLRTYLVRVDNVSNSLIKSLPEFFEMRLRYPFIILTDDFEKYHFVLISKKRKGRGKFESKIIKMEININNPKHTPLDILNHMKLEKNMDNPIEIFNHLNDALDVSAVTTKFYKDYKKVFEKVKNYFYKQKESIENAKDKAHRFSHQFLNRIMFLNFIQKKGWLDDNKEFLDWFWEMYRKEEGLNNHFYRKWLSVLFFEAFNNKFEPKFYFPEKINNVLSDAPFLNGGLFTENELDRIGYKIDDDHFRSIFDFFNRYNFTIKEDLPLEVDVAVDPEMIGKVYESLVNVSEESSERGDSGIFYTQRVEIDLMSKRSLVEYFSNNSSYDKDLFYDLVFASNNAEKREIDKKITNLKAWKDIRKLIEEAKIVDPACGSGSFLIGMLEILFDLYKRSCKYLDEDMESEFEAKKAIIGRSLYGVDVMQWAVDVAELRLWLQLIIETDIDEKELQSNPLLPNLSFNIRQGDSLIQEIGGYDFSFGAIQDDNFVIYGDVKKQLKTLSEEKYKFYQGNLESKFNSEKELLKEEINVYKSIIKSKINKEIEELNKLKGKKTFEQEAMNFGDKKEKIKLKGMSKEDRKEKINKLERQIDNDEEIIEKLDKSEENLFVWEIDFPEIFLGEKNGFDIVIGNPPYVRQENIKPPLPSSPKNYKDKLVNTIKSKYGLKLMKSSDLYVYFYIHGLSLLNKKGTFCFITSNSWLDSSFGTKLQEFLLDKVKMYSIYDNSSIRSFKQAEVNTIITLFGPINNETNYNWDNICKFIVFKKPFEELLNNKLIKKIENNNEKIMNENYRMYPIKQFELKDQGSEYKNSKIGKELSMEERLKSFGKYKGDKWGAKFFRAPDIYFNILDKNQNKMMKIKRYSKNVKRGFTSGCNEFFYLPSKHFDLKEDNNEFILLAKDEEKFDNIRIPKRYLKSFIKSPKELNKIELNKKNLEKKMFVCMEDKDEINNKDVLKYIRWGESKKFNERSSLKNRKPNWYSLGEIDYKIIVPSTHNPSWSVFLNENNLPFDKVLYGIKAKNNIKKIVAYLNSTFFLFQTEIIGYQLVGGGGLFIKVEDLENMLILKNIPNKILDPFESMLKRNYERIEKEIGIKLNIPIEKQTPSPLEDRKKLDNIIFDELDLTEKERNNIYKSTAKLIKNRLDKAKSK
jgi:hypothetical protein